MFIFSLVPLALILYAVLAICIVIYLSNDDDDDDEAILSIRQICSNGVTSSWCAKFFFI